MNLLCGEDDIVANFDFNHLMKRGRNTALRVKGIVVDNVHITPSIIRKHLLDAGFDSRRIECLLAPTDKQNVLLAQGLLCALHSLQPAASDRMPVYAESRRILRLLGLFYHHLLATYTDIHLSLSEQLEHLSALAHKAMALYTRFKGNFIPVQLYFDMVSIIKAAYFSVAKAQVANPGSKFWLILLGTDALENVFGIVRTMIGNDTNADQLQLASRLGSASLCAQLLQLHPEWDKGPNRLKLRPMEAGNISREHNHISPKAWQGDVQVSNVDLRTCWQRGATLAAKELSTCGLSSSFDDMQQCGLDVICPFEPGNIVLVGGLTVGEREEDEEDIDISSPITMGTTDSAAASGDQTAEELELDIEELADSDPTTHLPDEGNIVYPTFVDVTGAKRQHKGTVLRLYSTSLTTKDSKDRLK